MGEKEKTLCRYCAAILMDSGFKVVKVGGRADKITCENCGRRRYGAQFEAVKKEDRK